MQSRRVGVIVGVALLVVLATLTPAAYARRSQRPLPSSAHPAAPAPAVTFSQYLTVVRASGAEARFWAEHYTLPTGGCTMLHWNVVLAESVYLDGEGVPAVGSKQACPSASAQFYTLEVTDNAGMTTMHEVVLKVGDPGLSPAEVIAQGAVMEVTPRADADPDQAAAQPGYQLQLNSIEPLFVGQAGWNSATVTLGVTQTLIDDAAYGAPVDWPIARGQLVEFRATCAGPACTVSEQDRESYLYLRSE
jgi:hypothetical protein